MTDFSQLVYKRGVALGQWPHGNEGEVCEVHAVSEEQKRAAVGPHILASTRETVIGQVKIIITTTSAAKLITHLVEFWGKLV